MTGKPEKISRCALCGGRLTKGVATIPFVFPDTVVLVKDVPAEICLNCQEPFTDREVTDRLTDILSQARGMGAEVLIITYTDARFAPAPA